MIPEKKEMKLNKVTICFIYVLDFIASVCGKVCIFSFTQSEHITFFQ